MAEVVGAGELEMACRSLLPTLAESKRNRNFLGKARRKNLSKGLCFALSLKQNLGKSELLTPAEVSHHTSSWSTH